MAAGDVFPKMLSAITGGVTTPAPVSLNTTDTTIFTVPTSRQWAVKQIVVCNTDGVERLVTLSYNATSSTAGNCFVYRLPVAAYDTVVLDTAFIFEAGTTLRGQTDRGANSSPAAIVTVSVTGWEREL